LLIDSAFLAVRATVSCPCACFAQLKVLAQSIGKPLLSVILRIWNVGLWHFHWVSSGNSGICTARVSHQPTKMKQQIICVFIAKRCLRSKACYGKSRAIGCGSSVVEHTIGNGEVESSILSRSTSFSGFQYRVSFRDQFLRAQHTQPAPH
jgi:hypothetical protein